MEKVGRPKGLVRYDSTAGLERSTKRVLRPRIYVYGVLFLIGLTVMTLTIRSRQSFEANFLRAKGMPYTIEASVGEGPKLIRNNYRIHIQNKTDGKKTYRIVAELEKVEGPIEVIVSQSEVRLDAFGDIEVPIIARLPRDRFSQDFVLHFTVTELGESTTEALEVKFIGP